MSKHTTSSKAKKKALAWINASRFQDAKRLLGKICRSHPDDAEAWGLLGAVNGQLELLDEAIRCSRKAVSLRPDYAAAHQNLAQAYEYQERIAEAAECYRALMKLQPAVADWSFNLGHLLGMRGEFEEARQCLERTLQLKPDHAEAWNTLGHVLMGLGAGVWNAAQAFRQAVRLRPDWVKAQNDLGLQLVTLGALDEAFEHFERALALDPSSTGAIAGKASVLEKQGQLAPALELLQSVMKERPELGPADVELALAFARVARQTEGRQRATTVLERLLQKPGLHRADLQALNFQLGKLYEDRQAYDSAFRHFERSNQLKRRGTDGRVQQMARATEVFTQDFMSHAPRATHGSRRPLFIVGMPRSGTSLVEQILASHPAVFGASELDDIRLLTLGLPAALGSRRPYPECMRGVTSEVLDNAAQQYLSRLEQLSPDASCVTDKMPHNFMYLGLIELLFPGARVIHCRRDPLDTCVSIYTNDFLPGHTYATNLDQLGQHYRQYERLMAHWRTVITLPMLELEYEELVAKPSEVSRAIVAFCGLEWNEACLRFYESERLISTHSYQQVRRPIYTKSVGRWRNYEPYIGNLRTALENVSAT